jgi:hypothetical protein
LICYDDEAPHNHPTLPACESGYSHGFGMFHVKHPCLTMDQAYDAPEKSPTLVTDAQVTV